ncbi:MAG: sporulation protein [Candidatus Epulonipiscioides saccharophilum]|nr:MAG: sporulation protein [Epulopiscium sp. AS2M-Bin001]
MTENNIGTLLKDLEHFITTKTVVGEPIHIADTILVPLVDVSFGLGMGGKSSSKIKEKNKEKERYIDGPMGSNAGGVGAKISPSAVLVINNGTTQLINIKNQDSLSKLLDMAPGIMTGFPEFINKLKPEKSDKDKPEKDILAKNEEVSSMNEDFEEDDEELLF